MEILDKMNNITKITRTLSNVMYSELAGDSEVSSQSSVIGSGLWSSILVVDVLMVQLVRGLVGLGGWWHACGPCFNPRSGPYSCILM